MTRLRDRMRGLVVAAARHLPDGLVLDLLGSLSLHRRLDYAGADLFLKVETPEEYHVRLGSCKKEPETVAWIENALREGDVFYDVGANVGAYTLVASQAAGGGVKVYAFEPGFTNYAKLCQNVQLNRCQRNVVPLPIALAARTRFGRLVFSNLHAGPTTRLGNGNGEKSAAGQAIEQTIPTWRLDDLRRELGMEPPSLMKIDVDGAELEVLRGAPETLRDPALRAVQIELETDETAGHYPEVVGELEKAGFVLEAKYPHFRYANYLFVRRPKTTPPHQAKELTS